jgi:hypothetical protein
VTPGGIIDAANSLAVWNAVLNAAKSAGFKPTTGTIEETTVINANYFSWDGVSLGLTLVTGNATAPPPPTPTPAPEVP